MRSEVTPTLKPQAVRAHAITRDGRQILVDASGKVSILERLRAAWNHRRWNQGKRDRFL